MSPIQKILLNATRRLRRKELLLAFKKGELAGIIAAKEEVTRTLRSEGLRASHARLKAMPEITVHDLGPNFGKMRPIPQTAKPRH